MDSAFSSPPAAGVAPSPRARWFWPCVGLLLAIHGGMGFHAATTLSPTHDEYWHLPVGLLTWQTGRFDFDSINPPLARLWCALPHALAGVSSGDWSAAHDAFGYGDAFLAAHAADFEEQFFRGRVQTILLSLLTGVWLAHWSRSIFGPRGGALTAALYACCPNVLAHAALVTPDVPLTCAFVITLHAAWVYARKPRLTTALWLGICLGGAQLVKFTALLLFPAVPVLWLCLVLFRRGESGYASCRSRERLAQGVLLVMSACVVWNAGYLFQGTGERLAEHPFESHSLAGWNRAPDWVRRIPLPWPRDYLTGLDRQRQIMEGEHPVYLDGEWRTTGFPSYFVSAWVYKTPHAVQWVLAMSLAAWLLPVCRIFPGAPRGRWRECLGVLLPCALLVGIASSSGMQLGLRYILPVYPLLYVFAGQLPGRLCSAASLSAPAVVRWSVVVALLCVPLSLRHAPEYLAYFNELSGGVAQGERHLLDSNLDWGQDLGFLRQYVQSRREISDLKVAYFGMVPPAAYQLKYTLPETQRLQPGWYAISLNFVQGRPHTLREPDGTIRSVGLDALGSFRFFTPRARVGASINVYYLTIDDLRRYAAAVHHAQR